MKKEEDMEEEVEKNQKDAAAADYDDVEQF